MFCRVWGEGRAGEEGSEGSGRVVSAPSVGWRKPPLLAAGLGELGGAVCAAGAELGGGRGPRGGSGAAGEGGGMRGDGGAE